MLARVPLVAGVLARLLPGRAPRPPRAAGVMIRRGLAAVRPGARRPVGAPRPTTTLLVRKGRPLAAAAAVTAAVPVARRVRVLRTRTEPARPWRSSRVTRGLAPV